VVTLRGQNLEYLPEAVGPLYIGAVYSTSLFQIPGVTLQGYFLWDRLAIVRSETFDSEMYEK